MEHLNKLTRKQRVMISSQCDSFFITINKTKSGKVVFDYLKSTSQLPFKYDKELWMVVTAIGKSIKGGAEGTQIPLSAEKYQTANKKHQLKLNAQRASHVLEVLDEMGVLSYYKGYKDMKNNHSMTSCIIPCDYFRGLYTKNVLKNYRSNIDKTEMVVIKDSQTKKPLMKLTKFKGVNIQRQLMFDYNGLLSRNEITLAGQKCFVNYKQVFADDLDGAGRIYSFGGFQTSPSYMRSSIRINGNVTTECDIKGMHCMSLYCLEGIRVPVGFDPYTIDSTILGIGVKGSRAFCKMAVMCMINCKTVHGSAKALLNVWEKDQKESVVEDRDFPALTNCDLDKCKMVVRALQELNHRLDFYPKDTVLWKTLQRLDSKVMEGVISRFIKKDLVTLVWHDSVVVEKEHQKLLIQCIKDSWYSVFGTYDNCYVDIEF